MRLALCFSFTLLACARDELPPPDPLAWSITFDRSCDEHQELELVEAARAWELELEAACPIAFEIDRGDVPPFDAPLTWSAHAVEVRCDGVGIPAGADGYTRWNHGIGTARVVVSSTSIQHSYRHELGHALGLADGGDGIMSVSFSTTIERTDVELVAARWCPKRPTPLR